MKKLALLLILLGTVQGAVAETERGLASFYGDNLDGRKTASGEAYDKDAKPGKVCW